MLQIVQKECTMQPPEGATNTIERNISYTLLFPKTKIVNTKKLLLLQMYFTHDI